jgi:hypothetical protein
MSFLNIVSDDTRLSNGKYLYPILPLSSARYNGHNKPPLVSSNFQSVPVPLVKYPYPLVSSSQTVIPAGPFDYAKITMKPTNYLLPVYNTVVSKQLNNCEICISSLFGLLRCNAVTNLANWSHLSNYPEFTSLNLSLQDFINTIINCLDNKRKQVLNNICLIYNVCGFVDQNSLSDSQKLNRIIVQYLNDTVSNKEDCVMKYIDACNYQKINCALSVNPTASDRAQKLNMFTDFIFLCDYKNEPDVIQTVVMAIQNITSVGTLTSTVSTNLISQVIGEISAKVKSVSTPYMQNCQCVRA